LFSAAAKDFGDSRQGCCVNIVILKVSVPERNGCALCLTTTGAATLQVESTTASITKPFRYRPPVLAIWSLQFSELLNQISWQRGKKAY
jgi:hypothetical protein